MARRPATFTERDVRRFIKAVEATGLTVGAVEMDLATGKIRVSKTAEPQALDKEAALKQWLETNAG
jgi:hypothetical protein